MGLRKPEADVSAYVVSKVAASPSAVSVAPGDERYLPPILIQDFPLILARRRLHGALIRLTAADVRRRAVSRRKVTVRQDHRAASRSVLFGIAVAAYAALIAPAYSVGDAIE